MFKTKFIITAILFTILSFPIARGVTSYPGWLLTKTQPDFQKDEPYKFCLQSLGRITGWDGFKYYIWEGKRGWPFSFYNSDNHKVGAEISLTRIGNDPCGRYTRINFFGFMVNLLFFLIILKLIAVTIRNKRGASLIL